jgi:hypothetical protein
MEGNMSELTALYILLVVMPQSIVHSPEEAMLLLKAADRYKITLSPELRLQLNTEAGIIH